MNRQKRFMIALLNAICMSMVISFIMCAINVGLTDRFILAWLGSWPISFAIAFPLSYTLPPMINRLVNNFIQ